MDDFGLNPDGSSLFDVGLGSGYFDQSGGDTSFAPNPVTFGPDPNFGIGGNYDPSGGSIIPDLTDVNPGADIVQQYVANGTAGDSGGSGWASVLRALGIGGGSGGSGSGGIPWGQILSAILTGGGGLYARNQANRATEQTVAAINAANDKITGILGNGNSLYRPYADLGAQAAGKLAQLGPSTLASQFGPIAGQFQPLGTGRGIRLGDLSGR